LRLAVGLTARKDVLTRVFAGVILAVAAYMLFHSARAIGLL
jgi:hypothetical protein